jgi:hypothetical protein
VRRLAKKVLYVSSKPVGIIDDIASKSGFFAFFEYNGELKNVSANQQVMTAVKNLGWQSSLLCELALAHYLNPFRQKRRANHKAIAFDLMSHILHQFGIVECRAGLVS